MIPHFGLLISVPYLAYLAQLPSLSRSLSRLLWAIVVVALGLFAGLRGDSVGADTQAYVGRFRYLVINEVVWDHVGSVEPGYKLLVALSRLISDDPTALLVVTSLFGSILYVSAIKRLSILPALSIFVFIAFGFYSFHMNGLRQGLALGVYLHAIPSLLSRKPLRYTLWVCLASLFHMTALFTLPLYFLLLLRFSVRTVALLGLLSVLTALSMDTVLGFAGMANQRYAQYGQRTETGGSMLAIFHFLCALIFMVSRKFVRLEWQFIYGQFTLIFIYGTALYLIVLLTGSYVEMNRMALYFTVCMVFLWPMLLGSVRDTRIRGGGLTGLIIAGMMYQYIYLQQIGNFIPYLMR